MSYRWVEVAVGTIGVSLIIAGALMISASRQQPQAEPATPIRSQATCPPSIGARIFNRSVYREADNGEGVLVCFYELPPVK